jgi:hypothetical protein
VTGIVAGANLSGKWQGPTVEYVAVVYLLVLDV